MFDVGAHLGDRTRAFADLGATVVALEPQAHLRRWLTWLERNQSAVIVRPEAAGAEPGTALLAISQTTPTVSTLATAWRQGIGAANHTFRNVQWEEQVEVAVITLDALIDEHGRPDFCKIDVEGFELAVLQGLTQPLPALSIEFVQGSMDIARQCVARLNALGAYEFNVVIGEARSFVFSQWQDPATLLQWLEEGAERASSGDIYARLL
ncbi:MAG: FkbM family methyltransferase [Natronospirillum sp.]